jgi:hypothetical protein
MSPKVVEYPDSGKLGAMAGTLGGAIPPRHDPPLRQPERRRRLLGRGEVIGTPVVDLLSSRHKSEPTARFR